jgi:hypothetical protein
MNDVEAIRKELTGGDKWSSDGEVSSAFALAVNSFTGWPVDAWAGVRDEQGRLRKLYWVKGNALGELTAKGDQNALTVVGSMHLISNIRTVQLAAEVSLDDYHLGHGRRKITVVVDGGESLVVDVETCTGHLRLRADCFIDALVTAMSAKSSPGDS